MSFCTACCVHKMTVSVAGSAAKRVGQPGLAGYTLTRLVFKVVGIQSGNFHPLEVVSRYCELNRPSLYVWPHPN